MLRDPVDPETLSTEHDASYDRSFQEPEGTWTANVAVRRPTRLGAENRAIARVTALMTKATGRFRRPVRSYAL